jgi:hypothetical protein
MGSQPLLCFSAGCTAGYVKKEQLARSSSPHNYLFSYFINSIDIFCMTFVHLLAAE